MPLRALLPLGTESFKDANPCCTVSPAVDWRSRDRWRLCGYLSSQDALLRIVCTAKYCDRQQHLAAVTTTPARCSVTPTCCECACKCECIKNMTISRRARCCTYFYCVELSTQFRSSDLLLQVSPASRRRAARRIYSSPARPIQVAKHERCLCNVRVYVNRTVIAQT